MNFRRRHSREELEINFIPLIDLLLVILIFVLTSTTYSKYSELQINLPKADSSIPVIEKPLEVAVAVDNLGQVFVNGTPVAGNGPEAVSSALRKAAADKADAVVIINADRAANYQAVVNVMEAARLAGLNRLTFATQNQ
jgi:biopolymer transport protein ExbD